MFRKIALIPLITFGFTLSGMVDKCFADVSEELDQAKSDVVSLIRGGNYAQAKVQAEELIADFSGNPELPKIIYKIAEGYRWSSKSAKDKYEYAEIFYQQIIQDYPSSAYADKAALCISRGKVLSLIISQDFDAAEQALDDMVANFPNNPNLPDELYWIGRGFGYWERHEGEKSAYQQIIQNYPDSPYANRAQLGFAKANIQSLIISQDYEGADEALDEMIIDFSIHPDLSEALYWIAGRFEWSGRFEDAKSVHQQIIQNYPESSSASKSVLGLQRADVLSLIMSQDYDGADEVLDKMITNFSEHPDLPDTLLSIGKRCYEKGLSEEKEGFAFQSRGHLKKAVEIWDRLISEFPDFSLTPEACCWAGDCYLKLGKYRDSISCFQTVVNDYPEYEHAWHAQYTIGRCYEILKDTGAVEKSVADAQIDTAYEGLLEKYPDCPAVGYVSHRLQAEFEQEEQ